MNEQDKLEQYNEERREEAEYQDQRDDAVNDPVETTAAVIREAYLVQTTELAKLKRDYEHGLKTLWDGVTIERLEAGGGDIFEYVIAELTDLREVVGKLLKTADGVPIIIGETRVFAVGAHTGELMQGFVYAHTVGLKNKESYVRVAWERGGIVVGDIQIKASELWASSTEAAARAAGGL